MDESRFPAYVQGFRDIRRILHGIMVAAGIGIVTAAGSTHASETPPPTPEDSQEWQSGWPKLKGFDSYPPEIKAVVRMAFEMHDRGLTYQYGSADPDTGGMDCSGSVYYILKELGWNDVPRPSDGFYRWVWEAGTFSAVNGTTFDSYEWQNLKPGDLIFWVGTYSVDAKRDPPISHVMIYLGEDAKSGKKVIYGASEGRRYKGKRRSGVGLFDFNLPRTPAPGVVGAQFIGYSPIPTKQPTKAKTSR